MYEYRNLILGNMSDKNYVLKWWLLNCRPDRAESVTSTKKNANLQTWDLTKPSNINKNNYCHFNLNIAYKKILWSCDYFSQREEAQIYVPIGTYIKISAPAPILSH